MKQHYLQEAQQQITDLLSQSGDLRIHDIRQQVQDCLSQHCGVFRTADIIQAGLDQLQTYKQQYPTD